MITSDLLVTRISGGKIKPLYAAFNSENLELAKLLIETFEQHVGKTYGDLLSELEGYEEMNYRFIRGLSQLLGRRAVIETDAAVNSSLARETVFETCNGMALSSAEKKETFQKAAKILSISAQELEKSMWADLEENQVLKNFLPLTPAKLLKQYNLSLTQTLLFRAVDLDIWIKGDFQKMLWKIVRSGLMYSLEDIEDNITKIGVEAGEKRKEKITSEEKEKSRKKEKPEYPAVHLHLEGPGSLFRMSERYGNSFAKIFPVLMKSTGWKLKAKILQKTYQGKRVLELTLDDSEKAFRPSQEAVQYANENSTIYSVPSSEFQLEETKAEYDLGADGLEISEPGNGIRRIGSDKGPSMESDTDLEKETYDSSVEKLFSRFTLGSWKIKREPTILKAGRYAFVPDFALQRNDMKVYLEIVGFWTPEYLERKVEKLKEVKEPLILLINKKLKCSEKDFPAQEVIFFDKKIPANEIMKILRKYEQKQLKKDTLILQGTEISLSGELINLEEIASEKGIMLEALKEVIAKRLGKSRESQVLEIRENQEELKEPEIRLPEESETYVLLENYVIHRHMLEKIDNELKKPGNVELYSDAVKIFEGFGLDRILYYPVLELLGYKVIWAGLSEESAKVKRIKA
ncbi:MAG: DUF790 family protein [Methanosarcina sp.]